MEMKTCDICKKPNLKAYFDAKTTYGPWANMCLTCFRWNGIGLGVGRGQRYRWNGQGYDKIGG